MRFTISVAIISASLALPVQVLAADDACRQLDGARDDHASRLTRRYDDAISSQLSQMEIARAKASDAGCGFTVDAKQCAALDGALKEMSGNLAALEHERSLIVAGEAAKRSEPQLLAALDANGCRSGTGNGRIEFGGNVEATTAADGVARAEPEIKIIGIEAEPETDSPRRTPLSRMLDATENGEASNAIFSEPATQTYRTMCVRSCDGYFYPMSYAATTSEFERDEKRCEASCPGVAMDLYYGQTDVDDAARMQSTKSSRFYAELPAAFLHQKVSARAPASCVCNARKGFEIVAGKPPRGEDEPNILGEIRPPQAHGASELKEQAIHPSSRSSSILEIPLAGTKEPEALPADMMIEAPPVEDHAVRVVGPEFLPDQSGAKDRQGPAQQTVR